MYSIMLDKVSKSYQTNNYAVKAVNQADFAVDKGTSVAIIGPSGSGKSTLLNMMGLIIYPDFGRILINGEDVTNLPDTALCHFRNSYFGYVVQDFALIERESVFNNIRIPLLYRISCIARSNSFPAANVKELPLQEPLSVTNR